jgi:hypothetical protein
MQNRADAESVSRDVSRDTSRDVAGDISWMSYAELGKVRGISAASAKRLSNRRRWRKRAGNDGTTRVAVPVAELIARETRPQEVPGDVSRDDGRDIAGDVSRDIRLQLDEANSRADEANRRADAALTVADQTLRQLSDAVARADRAEAAASSERQRAEMLQTSMDELRASQTLMAETHTRDLAEAIRRAEDAAKENARQRVERLEHDRASSVAIADKAVHAAEQLRQADAERRGRGRWARLRAAWRGE